MADRAQSQDKPQDGPSAIFPPIVVAARKISGVNYKLAKISSAFDYACRIARPWSNSFIDRSRGEGPYLGREVELVALFGNRVVLGAIRNWRCGLRKPPRWAIDALVGELRRIENRAREARERLESGL